MSTPDNDRTNILWGWALFGFFVVVFLAVVGIGLIYDALLSS
jgi:hypothetical protein